MHPVLRAAFEQEMKLAEIHIARGELETALVHSERAHVMGQAWVIPHARSHWLMLKLEILRRRPVAATGQLVRIVLGSLGSALGKLPVGNTGGCDINMFKSMPIAPELQSIIDGIVPTDVAHN